MHVQRLFGTDGIRGHANEFPITGEIAMAVGQALTAVLQESPPLVGTSGKKRIKVVVGKDTRLSGYLLEQSLSAGICSMGADVVLIGPIPTPGVAFLTQSMRADAGIVISASHNPFQDNGIKIFSANGYKLPEEQERRIENLVLSDKTEYARPTGNLIGRASRIDEAHGRYIVFLKSLFPKDLDLSGMRIAIDCANGAAYRVAPSVFEELGADVVCINTNPTGTNINNDCGALHPDQIASFTTNHRASVGISLDGDADRCILSDETGAIVDGDQILGMCAIQMAETHSLRKNTIAVTPMSNLGLDMTLQSHGILVARTQAVGDRHVIELMRDNGLNLGGEQSGHIIFSDHVTTGDGILAALRVLEIMQRTGQPLSELKRRILRFPQITRNVRISKRDPFENHPEILLAIREAQAALKDKGRLLVRYSGTEPLVRIMVEGEEHTIIDELSLHIADSIEHHLG